MKAEKLQIQVAISILHKHKPIHVHTCTLYTVHCTLSVQSHDLHIYNAGYKKAI